MLGLPAFYFLDDRYVRVLRGSYPAVLLIPPPLSMALDHNQTWTNNQMQFSYKANHLNKLPMASFGGSNPISRISFLPMRPFPKLGTGLSGVLWCKFSTNIVFKIDSETSPIVNRRYFPISGMAKPVGGIDSVSRSRKTWVFGSAYEVLFFYLLEVSRQKWLTVRPSRTLIDRAIFPPLCDGR